MSETFKEISDGAASTGTRKQLFGFTISLITWFCIFFQLYLTAEPTSNFFSYFTILCNLLIALCTFFVSAAPRTKPGLFFSNLSVQTSIALYIFIVALVYNVVLRGIWQLTGWDLVVDNMLHVVIPILYILYWLFYRPKGKLEWNNGFYWIIFPFLYLAYSLIRGAVIAWYPYPFLNALRFGYNKVLINIGIMLIVFCVAGFILIAITRNLNRKTIK
jgi:hypothetical protein